MDGVNKLRKDAPRFRKHRTAALSFVINHNKARNVPFAKVH